MILQSFLDNEKSYQYLTKTSKYKWFLNYILKICLF